MSTPPPIGTASASALAQSLTRLALVSFNIAACQVSQASPRQWDSLDSTKAIRTEILHSQPDIVALQECPGDGADWAKAVFGDDGYQIMGATPSHAGYVTLLIKNGIDAQRVTTTAAGRDLPAVMAMLTHNERQVLVASVHLEPFQQGSVVRKYQMEQLIQMASGKPLIVAGDTNMRATEDVTMEKELTSVDFWKRAGSDRATKFTWDTVDHGTQWNRYYGDSTRSYTARYDRVYFSNPRSAKSNKNDLIIIKDFVVPSFALIANQPVSNKYHFLSDHFGIATTFELQWTKTEA
ncbi:hypothetical protein ACA910_007285 [Epithemia clementina (nom. ined.)]